MASRREEEDPRRAPYAITRAGQSVFREWFTHTAGLEFSGGPDDELTARLPFFGDVDPPDVRAVLDHVQELLWAEAKSLERERSTAMTTNGDASGFSSLVLVLGRRIRRVASDIAFVDDLRATFERWVVAQQPQAEEREVHRKRSRVRARR